MDSRIGRLLCLLVVMGMAGCNDAEMKKFVWTVRMLVFGAGGLLGAVIGLVVSLVHNNRNPDKIRSILLSVVAGCLIGGSAFIVIWLLFWHTIGFEILRELF